VKSGQGEATSSGNVEIATQDAGRKGISGSLELSTGMFSSYSLYTHSLIVHAHTYNCSSRLTLDTHKLRYVK
jgi:hypothetical protein